MSGVKQHVPLSPSTRAIVETMLLILP